MYADLRLALLALRRRPRFSGSCLGLLALGFGGAVLVMAALDAALLRPWPYRAADDLFALETRNEDQSFSNGLLSRVDLTRLNSEAETIEAAAGALMRSDVLSGQGEPLPVNVAAVTEGFHGLLGAPLLLGRQISPDEHAPGSRRTAVLSHRLWMRAFGAQADVIGKTLRLEESGDLTIVGVTRPYTELPQDADLWTGDRSRPVETSRSFKGFVRRTPGVSIDTLRARVDAQLRLVHQETSPSSRVPRAILTPLRDDTLGDSRPLLIMATASSGLLLLITCSSVTGLLLVRRVARLDEHSIQAALGAPPLSAVRQSAVEAVTLTTLGGLTGLTIAALGIRAFQMVSTRVVPELGFLAIDSRIAVAAGMLLLACIAFVTGVSTLAAPLPTGRPPRHSVSLGRSSGGRTAILDAIAGLGVAIAVVVAAATVSVAHSFTSLLRRDLGFQVTDRLALDISLPRAAYSRDAVTSWFSTLALGALHTPGVLGAGIAATVPLRTERDNTWTAVVVLANGETTDRFPVRQRFVSPGFLATMGISLVSGRDFAPSDEPGQAVLVNQTLARRYLNGLPAAPRGIGMFGWNRALRPEGASIVGVVADALYAGPRGDVEPTVYLPGLRPPGFRQSLVVTVEPGRNEELGQRIRSLVDSLEPRASVVLEPMNEALESHLARRRLGLWITAAFAALAVALAMAGAHALTAFRATQRRRELAVRAALGGGQRQAAAVLMRSAGSQAFAGSAAGSVAIILASRFWSALPGAEDPPVLLIAAAVAVVAVGVLSAAAIPVLRHAKSDLSLLLRH